MNYKLAQELKNAGFPQGEFPRISKEHPEGCGRWCNNGDEHSYLPTLSELIEACGDKIVSICRINDGWAAYAPNIGNVEHTYTPNGVPTPDEAVAHHWLAINKKP